MKYFTLRELTYSETAKKRNISNIADDKARRNLELLVKYILDPLREWYGEPIYINSGYRSIALNRAVGGKSTSHHLFGMAADITVRSKEGNKKLFDYIVEHLPFTQCINEKNYSWIHVSYDPKNLKKQVLHLK